MSKVACGSHHSLALTLEGEVSELNRGHYVAKGVLPTLVSKNLQGKRVSKVACGSHHSLALTLEGEVSELNRGHYGGKGGSHRGFCLR